MSDESSRERRPQLMPEEFRPATVFDYAMFGITLTVALAMTVPLTLIAGRTLSTTGPSRSVVCIAAWNFGVWMLPLLRVMLNWRAAVLGGVQNHSYLVRKFWHVQIVFVGLTMAVLLGLLILFTVICGPIRLGR